MSRIMARLYHAWFGRKSKSARFRARFGGVTRRHDRPSSVSGSTFSLRVGRAVRVLEPHAAAHAQRRARCAHDTTRVREARPTRPPVDRYLWLPVSLTRTRASRGRLSVLASRFSARVSHLRGVSPHHNVLSSARSCGMFYRTVVLERKNEEKTRWLSRPRSGEGDEGKAAWALWGGSHM